MQRAPAASKTSRGGALVERHQQVDVRRLAPGVRSGDHLLLIRLRPGEHPPDQIYQRAGFVVAVLLTPGAGGGLVQGRPGRNS